jgi:hypothetical protein
MNVEPSQEGKGSTGDGGPDSVVVPPAAESRDRVASNVWNDHRESIRDLLTQQAPALAGLYAYAIDALGHQPLELQDVMIAAHSVREICNRLPDVLPEVQGVFARSEGAVEALRRAWEEVGGDSLALQSDREDVGNADLSPLPREVVTVPRLIVERARDVVLEARRADRNAHARRSALVLGQVVIDDRRVRDYKKSLDFFVGFAHADEAFARPIPNVEKVLGHLEHIESVLEIRLTDFFATARRIGGCLEAANTQGPSGFTAPSADEVAEVWSLLNDPQHRRIFFDQLQNPEWLTPLIDSGAFDATPEPIVADDGSQRWDYWFEGDFLARMAGENPTEVSRALALASRTTNPSARRQITKAVADLPPEHAAAHVTAIGEYLDGGVSQWIDARDIATIIVQLANGDRFRPATRLARRAYGPRTGGQDPIGRRGEDAVATGIEAYWYQETFPEVAAALSARGDAWLQTLCAWVERYQTQSGHFEPSTGNDFSYQWRPSIERHPENLDYHHIGNALVEALLSCAWGQIETEDQLARVMATLDSRPQVLTRRIGLACLARAIDAGTRGAMELAESSLLDKRWLGVDARHEYSILARVALRRLSESAQEEWLHLVTSGPPQSDVEIEAIVGWHEAEGADIPALVARFKRVWQMRILSAIGMDSLPADAGEQLRELQDEFGIWAEEDMPGVVRSGWVVDEPDPTASAFTAMSVEEIVAFLREWRPPESRDPFGGPSHRGNAEALREAVQADPQKFAAAALSFRELHLVYVDALLTGLRMGIDRMPDECWDSVLHLGQWVAEQNDREEPATDHDSRSWWYGTQRNLIALIVAGLTSGQIASLSPDSRLAALGVVTSLLASPDPTPDMEQYGERSMDPLTTSMNTVRPSAAKCLTELVRIYSADDAPVGLAGEIGEALVALEQRLGSAKDPSLAMAAVFGQALVPLAWHQRDWFAPRLAELLDGDAAYRDVVITTCLSSYSPSQFLLELLRPALKSWIPVVTDADSPVTNGWNHRRTPATQLGDHLLLVAARGEIAIDDELLTEYFELASVQTRAEVVGHLGWRLMHASDAPETFLDRAMALYDWRADSAARLGSDEELQQFYWWVRSNKFSPDWWLPRLITAARSDAFDDHGMVGEQLARAAHTHPRLAFDALRILVLGGPRDRRPFGHHDLLQHAPEVLAEALDCGDERLAADVAELMDRLGRQGHIELETLVRAQRASDR